LFILIPNCDNVQHLPCLARIDVKAGFLQIAAATLLVNGDDTMWLRVHIACRKRFWIRRCIKLCVITL